MKTLFNVLFALFLPVSLPVCAAEQSPEEMVKQITDDVLDAIKRGSRAKPVQRSINLTPFGEDFCRVCLPLDYVEVEEPTEADPLV